MDRIVHVHWGNKKWYIVAKIVLTYCEKKCSSDWEKLLKFKAEGWEFAKILNSLEQFIQPIFGNRTLFPGGFSDLIN